MDRRLALVALWASFAAASVGVGFGAAGLVGGPFSDGIADAAALVPAPDPPGTTAAQTPGPRVPSAPSGSPQPTSPATSSDRGPASSGGAGTTTTRPEPARSVTRSIMTRGGLVSATCRSGLVQVSASPAMGWQIEDIDGSPQRDARVRFEQRDSRVQVEAGCSRGAPRFALDDDDSTGRGDSDDDDSGDDDPDDGDGEDGDDESGEDRSEGSSGGEGD